MGRRGNAKMPSLRSFPVAKSPKTKKKESDFERFRSTTQSSEGLVWATSLKYSVI